MGEAWADMEDGDTENYLVDGNGEGIEINMLDVITNTAQEQCMNFVGNNTNELGEAEDLGRVVNMLNHVMNDLGQFAYNLSDMNVLDPVVKFCGAEFTTIEEEFMNIYGVQQAGVTSRTSLACRTSSGARDIGSSSVLCESLRESCQQNHYIEVEANSLHDIGKQYEMCQHSLCDICQQDHYIEVEAISVRDVGQQYEIYQHSLYESC